jgi:hypothetical protein
MSMSFVMTKCCHQCQRGRLLDNWFRQLVVIYLNLWIVMLEIDVNPWRSLATKSGSTKVWVRDSSLV